MSKYKNPIAVAMRERYSNQQTSHKHRCEPRGGDRNDQQELLEELEDEQIEIEGKT